jgi:hypothetical protein
MRFKTGIWLLWLVAACSGDISDGTGSADTEADAVDDTGGDLGLGDAGLDDPDASDADAEDAVDRSRDRVDEEVAGNDDTIRFVAFGDWGIPALLIEIGADAMWEHCQTAGCDFVIGLGDNFYDDGVRGVDDPQWEDKFEGPFAQWDIPFYMTLGNHDHYQDVAPQVDYSDLSDKWMMPGVTYELRTGPIHFFALDTDVIDWEQGAWAHNGVLDSEAPWQIAFGHHPWRSNGAHGDASDDRRQIYEQAFCDRLDLIISGHDHDLQLLMPECGTYQVISGAIGFTRDVGTEENTLFATNEAGFAWFAISEETIRVEFHSRGGDLLHEAVIERRGPPSECSEDGYCESACDDDPDCSDLDCRDDGECDARCTDDPDCFGDCPCDFRTGICEPADDPSTERCGCDPMCRGDGRPCSEDGHCDTWCPEGADPDCE